jgi:hypothetical protein
VCYSRSFLSFSSPLSLPFPLPPSPSLLFLVALSLLPQPEPSHAAPSTREDGGARQERLGEVAHVRCVRCADERTLALHTESKSSAVQGTSLLGLTHKSLYH